MAKITLDDSATGFNSVGKINSNNNTIEDHLNNKVLYRDNPDGEANQMLNSLDMNSNRMLNLPNALTNQEPATYGQLIATLASAQGELGSTTLVENQTAIEDKQATYTLVNPYIPGLNNLAIYRNGVRITNTSYTEVDVNTVRIDAPSVNAITAGDIFTFVVNESTVVPEVGASTVREELTATSNGQTVFNLNIGYVPGANNLSVYRNGAKIPLSAYVETDANTVTFTASEATSIVTGDEFEFIVNERDVSTATTPASNVTYTPEGTNPTTVSIATYLDKRVLDDVTALRAYEPVVDEEQVWLLGHSTKGVGGGELYYDETDTTTADNGVTVFVTAGGARWKRPPLDDLYVEMGGAIADGNADDTNAIQACLNTGHLSIKFSGSRYKITSDLTVSTIFQSLQGTGTGTKIDAYTNSIACFNVQANNVNIDGFHFVAQVNTGTNDIVAIDNSQSGNGLSMKCNNIFTSQIGTPFKLGKECLLSNLTLEFFRRAAVHIVGGQFISVDNFYFHQGREAILVEGVSFASGVAVSFSNGHILGIEGSYAYDATAGNAIRLKESRKCNFSNVLIQSTDEDAIYIEGTSTTSSRFHNFSNMTFVDIGYTTVGTKDIFKGEYAEDIGINNAIVDGTANARYGINMDTNSARWQLSGNKPHNTASGLSTGAGVFEGLQLDNYSYLGNSVSKTSGDTTIDVDGYTVVRVFDSTATNFTGFTGGLPGQEVTMRFSSANTTLIDSTNFAVGGSDFTPAANTAYKFIKDTTARWTLIQ